VAPRAMRFQNEWGQANPLIDDSDILVLHGRLTAADREPYPEEVVVPHTRYINSMVLVESAGQRTTESQSFGDGWKIVAQPQVDGDRSSFGKSRIGWSAIPIFGLTPGLCFFAPGID
jgi:hypothetical protein